MDIDDTIAELIKSAIPLMLGYVIAWIRTTMNNKKSAMEEAKLLRLALQSLLRDRLIQAYNHYVEDKRWCPHYAKDSISNMYKYYEKLGANGVISHNIELIMSLPETPQGLQNDSKIN
jgi:hypothetical protein